MLPVEEGLDNSLFFRCGSWTTQFSEKKYFLCHVGLLNFFQYLALLAAVIPKVIENRSIEFAKHLSKKTLKSEVDEALLKLCYFR